MRLSAKPTRQRSGRQRNLCRVPRGRHSAKDLPSATPALGKGNGRRQLDGTICQVPTCQPLGKGNFFLKNSSPSANVSGTRHFFLKNSLPTATWGTRQRFFLKKAFAECWHSAKVWSLCRVPRQHSAKLGSAGKNAQLCRVLALGKAGIFFCFFLFSCIPDMQFHIYS